MAEGRGEDEWAFRSAVLAELYNLTRSTKDRDGRPYEAHEFNPYHEGPPPAPAVDGYLDAQELGILFCPRKRSRVESRESSATRPKHC